MSMLCALVADLDMSICDLSGLSRSKHVFSSTTILSYVRVLTTLTTPTTFKIIPK